MLALKNRIMARLMNLLARLRREDGQTATEYMLIISVIVVAVVAAAYIFIEPFQTGVNNLANDVRSILAGGVVNGTGIKR